MVNSRNKGAAFERQLAAKLFDELGIEFSRDLRQYQAANHGDLVASEPDFPFLIEAKAHKSGTDCKREWMMQAQKAAIKAQKQPVVAYKYNRHPIRFRVTLGVVGAAMGAGCDIEGVADLFLPEFCYISRELMAISKGNPMQVIPFFRE